MMINLHNLIQIQKFKVEYSKIKKFIEYKDKNILEILKVAKYPI
jgi:hypothetical protein